MEIANFTGSIQKKGLRNSKPISQLLFGMSGDLTDITNEEISVFIESQSGENISILKNIKVRPLILLAQHGEGAIHVDDDGLGGQVLSAGIELTPGNSIALTNDEVMIIDMAGLKAAQTYTLDGLEAPNLQRVITKYELKKILAGEASKDLDVAGYDKVCISGRANITEIDITFVNGFTGKYGPRELQHMMSETNDTR